MKILLAVPTRGTLHWTTARRIEEIRKHTPGLDPTLYCSGSISVAQTRNKVVKAFLRGRWDVLAMLDDDVTPPPYWLDTARELEKDNWGLIVLPYPLTKGPRIHASLFEERPDGLMYPVEPEFGLHDCDMAGLGASLIPRRALEELGPAPFKAPDDPDVRPAGEDFIFCKELREHGYRVGYWHDNWPLDHNRTISLASLLAYH